MKNFYCKTILVKVMRITSLVLGIQISMIGLLAAREGNSQTLSLNIKEARITKVFQAIEEQSEVRFVYDKNNLDPISPITIRVTDIPLAAVLKQLEHQAPIRFRQKGNLIGVNVIRMRSEVSPDPLPSESMFQTVTGKVTEPGGQPLPGVNILIKGTARGTSSDVDGNYSMEADGKDVLVFSFIGYKPVEAQIGGRSIIDVVLEEDISSLDEVVINAGYYETTEKLKTGSIAKITAEEISNQPVADPLATLQGRVPGLVVTQGNGVPGSSFSVQIRGQNSLNSGFSQPLFIIDGVPFAPNNEQINLVTSAFSDFNGNGVGLSPFLTLNPNDIESIEVLKDADATAIYGSRGGNGVILITTKRSKASGTQFHLNFTTGFRNAPRTTDFLNTDQYLLMRKEALSNDGVDPTISNAPDLVLFEQDKSTDFQDYLTGRTARTNDAQFAISGGSQTTHFRINGNFHHETTVYPGDFSANRVGVQYNFNHQSDDSRFHLDFTGFYAQANTGLSAVGVETYTSLPPNHPDLIDKSGDLVWEYEGYGFDNPLAYLLQKYDSRTRNLNNNMNLRYSIIRNVDFIINTGYNTVTVDEISTAPITSQNPQYNPLGYTYFGDNNYGSWSIEPQIRYTGQILGIQSQVQLGGTWQETENKGESIFAYGYSNDALLESLSAATTLYPTDNYFKYRYQAFFGRINLNYQDRYILNITGRRDGSSRFGPDRQFSNFGAVGAAWIFTEERFLKGITKIVSYGKLRSSYGVTGTDQIANYQYLDSWTNTTYPYGQSQGLYPTRLANPDYVWERNKKMEIAVELGFLMDRITVAGAYYQNRSDNHLINYKLPSQTGFISITRNFPALVQNKGFEFTFNMTVLSSPNFTWSVNGNLTIPENKLLSFPDLETSSYAGRYEVGKSLSFVRTFEFLGVNPETGVFELNDLNDDERYTSEDYIDLFDLDPDYYGGVGTNIEWFGIRLDMLWEFRNQKGNNYRTEMYRKVPGTVNNLPKEALTRWVNPGDQTDIQKFSSTASSEAYIASRLFSSLTNSGWYTDASFVRLRNVSLSYDLPERLVTKLRLNHIRFTISGQNLLTISNYKVGDPETQSYLNLPPLRTLSVGLDVSF